MMIKKTKIAVTTTGSAGSASGTGVSDTVIQGQILRVDVDYHASAPATTDITIAQTNEAIAANIVSKSNSNTDATYYPQVQVTDNGGTGLTYDGTRVVSMPYVACDTLTVTVSQCDALTNAVVVEVYYRE